MEQRHTVGTAVSPSRALSVQGKGESSVQSREVKILPLTVEAARLLRSAQVQLEQSGAAADEFERYSHAHFAALRLAGAVIESVTGGAKSRRVETIWQKLSRVAPELAVWAVVFEESAVIRASAEAGDLRSLRRTGAEFWCGQARAFQRAVVEMFGASNSVQQPRTAA